MDNKDFSTTISFDQTPTEVFRAVINVRDWWSEEIAGNSAEVDDEFVYRYKDVHNCKMKIIEVVPDKKIVWLVLDNYFSFTRDKTEWIGDKIIFEINKEDDKTLLHFTHEGLVPEKECYSACYNGLTQYIDHSLSGLIRTGKGAPNSSERAHTVHEVAAQFNELAQQEKWFEIQEALFADDIKSIEPDNSPYFKNAEGKSMVRKKGEDFIKRIEAFHSAHTSEPVIAGKHFAVGRNLDITVEGHGRIKMDQIMLYEVRDGKIISEQFFY